MKLFHTICFLLTAITITSSVASAAGTSDSDKVRELIERGLHDVYGADAARMSFVVLETKPGDVASGVETLQTSTTIAIDTTPCNNQKTIVTFVNPYKKHDISDIKCGDKTYPRVQVMQQ